MQALRVNPGQGWLVGLGLAATAALAAGVTLIGASASSDVLTGLVLAPVLVALTLPALARQARLEGDRRLLVLLVAALVAKMLATFVRFHVTFDVYDRADASDYHEVGAVLGERFRSGNFSTAGLKGAIVSTNFIRVFTGVVYALVGPSRLGGFVFYSWLAFIGLFFFYRAYVVGVSDGRGRDFARLGLFLPSLLYWPSSIGKESFMVFGLGLTCYGVACMLRRGLLSGLLPTACGMWLAGIVRPHMVGLVGVALAVAYVLRRPPAGLRELGPVVKVTTVAAAVAVAVMLVASSEQFVESKGVSLDSGLAGALEQTSERTDAGGSEFTPPNVLASPLNAPLAVLTVLFRPLVFEANNLQALLAALEGTFLLVLCMRRAGHLRAALGEARTRAYLVFAAAYTALFVVAFSGIANFGLLVRQRAQLLPVFLVLLYVSRPAAEDEREVGGGLVTARP